MTINLIKYIGLFFISVNIFAVPDTTNFINSDTICDEYYYETGELSAFGCLTKRNDSEIKQGLWIFYHKNGNISDSITFLNNQIIGKRVSFYSKGGMSQIAYYKTDSVLINYFFENKKSYIGSYKQSNNRLIPVGLFVHYYKNMVISDSVIYNNGEQISSKHFYKNGMLFVKTVISEDKKSRERCVYKKNGAIRDCDNEIWTKNAKGVETWVDTNPDPMNIWTIILPIAASMIVVGLL